ncbi:MULTISPECIES: transmembrane and coiled-coil domain protein [unclassified Chryseobacterium]|uniref:transmembrane and coiled-coil domain protein n=1 Tax=unclassified Chryseobacterium TaxID=2593645 RepID=UPI0021E53BB5|nr:MULTISPECIES: transmembrane and coiled-coil domain protein [unclassified Chryseobacterium]MEA1850086.1 beta-carotene 15,15'-monooxygenase [Chryseobacterium sp. MHB01]
MDTASIKNLFKLKSVPIEKQEEQLPKNEISTTEDSSEESRKRTYHESGYRDSSRTSGNHSTLSICLDAVYSKFQNEEKEMVEKQQKLKESYINEQKNRETEIKALTVSQETKEEQLKTKNKEIENHQNSIDNLKAEILDLPRNPEKYNVKATKGASAKFWIGLILLIPITLYLATFYISTSYSAFFKSFDARSTVIQSVLDANAWMKAWNDGFIEVSFVTLIPFVFLGLGFLIHMFGENKTKVNYVKLGLLFLVTFVFDSILAYEIESKLYELNKTFDSPPFDLKIAFTKIQFWGIIFAGFIVYIIWGLVFDFVMKEHREKDRIRSEQEIRQKKILSLSEKINALKKETEEITANIGSIKELIIKTRGRIEELQNIIDSVIIPTKDYKRYASEYVQGWITFIGEKIAVSKTEKQTMIENCIATYETNLERVGANSDTQNLVYLSAL